MQLKYGGYSFPVNGCNVRSRTEIVMNAAQVPYKYKGIIEVDGWLTGSGQSAISSAMRTLQSALAVPYRDLILYQDDGAESATIMKNAGSITGVVITRGPDFPENRGSEYATTRYFTFTAECEYPLPNAGTVLLEFQETLTFSGGGPLYVCKRAINTGPQRQLVCPQDAYRVVQQGRSVAFAVTPVYPPPTWPFALKQAPDIKRISPGRLGPSQVNIGVEWTYMFESVTPLVGAPNLWLG